MMQDWQTALFMESQSLMVEVVAMQVANTARGIVGESAKYGEESFQEHAAEILRLSREIRET